MVSSIQGMGPMRPMGQMQGPKALSEEQKQTVQELLADYDPESITAEGAKTIFKSLREAGIRGGGLREAIQEAGFDADNLFSLAHDGQKPPAPPPGGMGGGMHGSGTINSSALQTLQSILSQFDLVNLSNDDQKSLVSQLTDTGLLKTGSMIDLGI